MTQTPPDPTPDSPDNYRPPALPPQKRPMWPWVVGGSVLLLIVVAVAVFFLTPPTGMVQIP